jgi:methionine-rich copper-binding protein CopC
MKAHGAPKWAFAFLFATLLAFALAAIEPLSARGHADLLSSDPSAGQIIESMPKTVTLEFAENILIVGASEDANQILVSNEAGERIDNGEVVIAGANVSTQVDQSAANGKYSVVYRVVSADGHPIEGSFSFVVGEEATNVIAPAPADELEHTARTQDWTLMFLSIVGLATAGALAFIFRRKSSRKSI